MTGNWFAKVIGASAALILVAAATTPTFVHGQGGAAAPSNSKSAGARNQEEQDAQAPAGKSDSGAAAKKKGKAHAPVPPPVVEIDEAGLKALLDEHARGGRRLLINFWATWCTPCREEFPDLVKIDREFSGAEDFEFVTISSDDVSEIGTTVPVFLSEMGATMPAYLLNAKDPEAAIAAIDASWHGDLPATFLFGPDGKLLFKHKGRITAGKLRQAIKDSSKTVISDK
jgi:thiol-disulfide isomerase/thioredoxin